MIEKNYLPTRRSKIRCLLVLALMIGIYIIQNSSVASFIGVGSQLFYYIKPVLWVGCAVIVWNLPKVHPKGKLKHRSFLNLWAFNFGVLYIVVSIITGMIDGFGKSPYNRSIIGVITNICFVGTTLIGKEFIRSYLVNHLTKKENYFIFILVSLFMTVTTISFNQVLSLQELPTIIEFIARYFAPEFCQNLMATYLVFLGGPLTSMIYLGIFQLFHWLSPILPDVKWITAALIGILCPVFSLITLQNMYAKEAKQTKNTAQDEEGILGWIITSIISIGIVWFVVGVFPIYPSVIATGSMEPMIYPGDLILVRKIGDIEDIHRLQVGDVIQFRRNDILISHRIIDIREDDKGMTSYQTRGDNNTAVDTRLVKPEEINGTIIKVVPKVGWPTLLLKQKNDVLLEDIQF
ncbi:peptidase S26B, signal peptidase [Clostridium aceticum]|uniref:Signal peptidase I n=1 Tax=Clostridium aceticum TaxID=84022 RepID=A0A0G3W915_9CLOT|nr:signal peptidase I [Clostridium aceticum]AKL94402.1 peptidase S26B, signal peptidase [Clostridium aceticum]